MGKKECDDLAMAYAEKHGMDSVRPAGERDGVRLYHIFESGTLGRKLGLPIIISVNEDGNVDYVDDFAEIMWAIGQEVLINGL